MTAERMYALADSLERHLEKEPNASITILPREAADIAEVLKKIYGVSSWVFTDFERVINGILCRHHRTCRDCNFRCAKWRGEDFDPGKQVAKIREILDDWETKR